MCICFSGGLLYSVHVFVVRVFAAVTFGGMAIGRASAHLPDYIKAKQAAAQIKALLGKESTIDPTSAEGAIPVSELSGALVCPHSLSYNEVQRSFCANFFFDSAQ